MSSQGAVAAELLISSLQCAINNAKEFKEAKEAIDRTAEGRTLEERLTAKLERTAAAIRMCDTCAHFAVAIQRSAELVKELQAAIESAFSELETMRRESRAAIERDARGGGHI
jgi:hypothetical protein